MAEKTFLKSAKRFGPRYGRTVKFKFDAVEKLHKGKHKCPYCHKEKAKRLSAGIWQCSKCNAKFTGRAYETKPVKVEEE